jgi:hypothetical protein
MVDFYGGKNQWFISGIAFPLKEKDADIRASELKYFPFKDIGFVNSIKGKEILSDFVGDGEAEEEIRWDNINHLL